MELSSDPEALSKPLLESQNDSFISVSGATDRLEGQIKKKLIKIPRKKHQFRELWVNYGIVSTVIFVWASINLILFIEAANRHWNKPNYYVTVARGFGQLLNFNCALILLPVMRNLLTRLRKTPVHKFFPWDVNIAFHRWLAYWIAICGGFHGAAHYLNYNEQNVENDAPSVWSQGYTNIAGFTGHGICFVMIVMYTTAQLSVKRNHFNLFFLLHHLFLAFYIMLLFHGPRFWYWFLLPAALYTIERITREWRGAQHTCVISTIRHPSDVIEIRMDKPSFKYKCGQYLYLNCPYISRYEWHPFTISSSPLEKYVSVHIRCVGPWTRGLDAIVGATSIGNELVLNKEKGPDGSPILKVDGPFGSASEDVFHYEVALLCGAGIGVTPFASILRSLSYHIRDDSKRNQMKLKKVYFFWVSRDHTAFEWFGDLLVDLERDIKEYGYMLEINIFLTGRMKHDQIESLMVGSAESGVDEFTKLESKTNFGRPRWDRIFSSLRDRHRNQKVGVFFCGPAPLAKVLQKMSRKYSKESNIYGCRFVFHKENF